MLVFFLLLWAEESSRGGEALLLARSGNPPHDWGCTTYFRPGLSIEPGHMVAR
jgi:hypothetical protein